MRKRYYLAILCAAASMALYPVRVAAAETVVAAVQTETAEQENEISGKEDTPGQEDKSISKGAEKEDGEEDKDDPDGRMPEGAEDAPENTVKKESAVEEDKEKAGSEITNKNDIEKECSADAAQQADESDKEDSGIKERDDDADKKQPEENAPYIYVKRPENTPEENNADVSVKDNTDEQIQKTVSPDIHLKDDDVPEKKNAWEETENGKIYYGKDGRPVTGSAVIDGAKYLFSDKGALAASEGWVAYKGTEYRVDKEGRLRCSEWIKDKNGTYYTTEDGQKAKGWKTIENGRYYFMDESYAVYNENSAGKMLTGFKTISGKRYYFMDSRYIKYTDAERGKVMTGFKTIGKNVYYFTDSRMKGYKAADKNTIATGAKVINGKICYFNNAGVQSSGWFVMNDRLYYMQKDKNISKGIKNIGGTKYDFGKTGSVKKAGWIKTNAGKYYVGRNGKILKGLNPINGKRYLFSSDGKLLPGINDVDGKIYKGTVNGFVTDVINKKNIVSFIRSDGLVLSMKRSSGFGEGDLIYLKESEKDNTQKWELVKNKNGSYKIRNVYTGAYLNAGCRGIKTGNFKNSVNADWNIIESKNGIKIVNTKNKDKTIGAETGLALKMEKERSANIKDILYTDTDKVISKINKEVKEGKKRVYKINGSEADLKRIEKYFSEHDYNNRLNYVTYNSGVISSWNASEGKITIDTGNRVNDYKEYRYIQNTLTKVSRSLGITKNTPEKEKVRRINAYICSNYDYIFVDRTRYTPTLFNTIKNKQGLCETFSYIFYELGKMNGLNIRTYSVKSNDPKEAGHALNRVRINGKWYYCDSTWNRGIEYRWNGFDHYLFMSDLRNHGYGSTLDLSTLRVTQK